MRIERALVAGAAGCLAMLRPLCSLMGRDGNALHTVRLGGNGAWAEGDGATLAAALGAASCVVAELDVSGSGLGADEAVALVLAGRALQTLRLGEWVMPVGELQSSESVSPGGGRGRWRRRGRAPQGKDPPIVARSERLVMRARGAGADPRGPEGERGAAGRAAAGQPGGGRGRGRRRGRAPQREHQPVDAQSEQLVVRGRGCASDRRGPARECIGGLCVCQSPRANTSSIVRPPSAFSRSAGSMRTAVGSLRRTERMSVFEPVRARAVGVAGSTRVGGGPCAASRAHALLNRSGPLHRRALAAPTPAPRVCEAAV